jgi:predicted transcriptional regulator
MRARQSTIEQAIARYVEQEAWKVEAIGAALAEYRGGKAGVQSHSAVMDRLAAKIRARGR